jgi:hypothetical protein
MSRCSPPSSATRWAAVSGDADFAPRPALERGRIDHREIELRVVRAEPVEQVERLIDDPFRARTRAIHLVDDDNRAQPLLQRLQRDEARLRHRSFDGVDEQQHTVDHAEHTLDLAAEIRMAGRVDDVDVGVEIANRAVLGEDRDATFALDVVAVHHPLADVLVLRERAGLDQQLVDERRLAVVDVGDDRDVAQVGAELGHGKTADYSLRAGRLATNILKNPSLTVQSDLGDGRSGHRLPKPGARIMRRRPTLPNDIPLPGPETA